MADNPRNLLKEVLAWISKCQDREYDGDSPAGINYQNGDGDKYKGDAWTDIEKLRKRIKKVVG